jgi:hypothetical protein
VSTTRETMQTQRPDLHVPGWPEMRFHGSAETDGLIWWRESRLADGSIKRHALQPYGYSAAIRSGL